jgi:uncharacterized membrane protein
MPSRWSDKRCPGCHHDLGETVTSLDDAIGVREVETSRSAAGRVRVRAGSFGRAAVRLRSLTVAERLAYGATCIYGAIFTVFATARHLAFLSQKDDLGNMTQAIWATLHGHLLSTTTETGAQVSRLGIHVDPFLLLLTPLWWLWSSPLMLVTVQALAVSAGALPVFWLARKHLESERAAVFFVFAYLLYPSTQFNAFAVSSGFHSVTIAIPLLLLAIWFLDEDRLLPFAAVAVLAATTKEEIPLVIGILGIWYGRSHGRWRVGMPLFGAGLAVTLVNFLVVLPHFNGGGYTFGDRYSAVGGSPAGIARTAVTDPMALVHDVATTHKLVYLLLVFAPFLGLWLFEPLLILAAIPELAINLLSNDPNQTAIPFHGASGMVPFVVAASIFGLARLRRLVPSLDGQVKRIAVYACAAVAVTAVYSPFVIGVGWVTQAFPSNAVHRAKAKALSVVPPGVPVSASNQLGAHLSERLRIMIFPVVREANWVVVDKDDPTYGDEQSYLRRIDALRHASNWSLAYSSHDVLVFHRVR